MISQQKNPMKDINWFDEKFRSIDSEVRLSHVTGAHIVGRGSVYTIHVLTKREPEVTRDKIEPWLTANKFDFELKLKQVTSTEMQEFEQKVFGQ